MISRLHRRILIFTSLALFLFSSHSIAATLQLTRIGNLDLGGKVYNEWWYTGVSPTFYGTAAANSNVSVKVGAETFSAKADSTGSWYYASALPGGDYDISITSGQETLAFKLHLGQDVPENIGSSTAQSTQAVTPITGYNQVVLICLSAGILLLATYFYIIGDPRRKSIFEAKMLQE